jgi:CDK inhibitor PHO81
LLLQRDAKCLPNSNGRYPLHLAAREGHVEVCKLLVHREGWDTPDKYHEWTPLFHAARYGHDECIQVLLEARCRVNITDEFGNLAVHYAAWYGHHGCVSRLLEAAISSPAASDVTRFEECSPMSDIIKPQDVEIDLIPSLSLPPPMMSHRVYGHNYLDKSYLVQITIGHPSSQPKDSARAIKAGVRLHRRLISPTSNDECLLSTTPLKMVMTTSPDVNSAPYSISLPQRDEESVFTFQIPSLDKLSLEFSIYPNFGTKTIGRAIALPSLFNHIQNSCPFVLPILDHRLHVAGEVCISSRRIHLY